MLAFRMGVNQITTMKVQEDINYSLDEGLSIANFFQQEHSQSKTLFEAMKRLRVHFTRKRLGENSHGCLIITTHQLLPSFFYI